MKNSNCEIKNILVNDLASPLGITPERAVISWKTVSDRDGFLQEAYRVTISDGEKVAFDSGRVECGCSTGITVRDLEPMTEYSLNVTVWGNRGEEISASSSFETGLPTECPFGEAKWISHDTEPLYMGTKYSIDFDFMIELGGQAFCLSIKDNDNMIMWQVNNSKSDRVLLRPHVREGGEWVGFSGAKYDLPEFDVTDVIGYSSKEIPYKRIHERIEVDGKKTKTYFGPDAEHLVLGAEYEHFEEIPLINFGFCQSASAPNEVAAYGNIVICDGDGNRIYEKDFTDGTLDFTHRYRMTVDGDMAWVSAEGAAHRLLCERTTSGGSMPAFRREIELAKVPVSARLYTSGLGAYEAYVNGERVGRKQADGTREYDELKSGFTETFVRKFYNTYDVTDQLTEGKNVLSAVVTPGWWSGVVNASEGKETAFLGKLVVKYGDGRTEIFDTDTSWRSAEVSPFVFCDIFAGETYDARISEDYKYAGFDDSTWKNVKINTEFNGIICPWMGSTVTFRRDLELSPASVCVYRGAVGAGEDRHGKINVIKTPNGEPFTLSPGEVALFDLGQNFAGHEAFSVSGERGTCITVKHGEIANDDDGLFCRGNEGPEGSVYNKNYRFATSLTKYYMSGEGIESYSPSFTFYGFRYAELTADREITVHSFTGRVITSVERETGFIETSDKDVNQLISNVLWSQYSNYLSIPTDCPQRDERQGWLGDTQVFARAGCYLGFSKSFLSKFCADMRDGQDEEGLYPCTSPKGEFEGGLWGAVGWADAGIIVPYVLYTHYGDKNILLDSWDSMQAYMDKFLAFTGKKGPYGHFGDWLAFEANDNGIKEVLSVAFYAWDALMMAEMADVIGKSEDAEKYRRVYEEEKEFFISLYVNEDGTLKRGAQALCLYALFLDLLPNEKSVKAVTDQLVSNIRENGDRISTGFLGTAIFLPTLTKLGLDDIAYTLLLQHDNPSWLYSVDQGATTIWERWDSYTKEEGFGEVGMNSFNHYAYGAVAYWMFETMAGIMPAEPGFKKIKIAPRPDKRLDVKAEYDSAYGRITAESKLTDGVWTYNFSIPSNTTAVLEIPGEVTDISSSSDDAVITPDGKAGGLNLYTALAGKYEIKVKF